MVKIEGLVKRYRPNDPPALDGVSLQVQHGEIVALLGPSGAGKSTLIRIINGLVQPDAGLVEVNGQRPSALSAPELQGLRRRIGMIFQEFNLIERYSVTSNIMSGCFGRYPFWRNLLSLWSQADVSAAKALISRVGLNGQADSLARDLSGGQRQRVAIARAMMQQPVLLLGDEPVSSLDPVTARGIMKLLVDLTVERGVTTIVSLHDVNIAREFCQRAIGMSQGRILYDGPIDAVDEAMLSQIYGTQPRTEMDKTARGVSPAIASGLYWAD